MPKKQPFSIKMPERAQPGAAAGSAQPIYELSTTSLDTPPTSTALPPEAEQLSGQLRELAIRFLGARRRVGEALLEACRYMGEARAAAEEGQWHLFLQVIGTSSDSAEILLNIHYRAGQYPVFAEKLRSGWLNQTVAGELAKPSTPPELLQELLQRKTPLRVADVKQARQRLSPPRAHLHVVDNPDYSDSPARSEPVDALLDEVASSLEAIADQAHNLLPDEQTLNTIRRIEQATTAIRGIVERAG